MGVKETNGVHDNRIFMKKAITPFGRFAQLTVIYFYISWLSGLSRILSENRKQCRP